MKKGLLTGTGRFEVKEYPVPEPGAGEVRLRVEAAGICGTDLEVYRGHIPSGWSVEYPFQMGHELSGVVDKVGDGVTSVKEGDRVVPDGRLPCGYCPFCRRGEVNACQNGGYTSGGFTEYSMYGYKALVPVPDNVSFREAAMAEPLSCVMYGNGKINVEVGDFAVVIGEGAIGLLHAQLLKNRGAETAVVGLIEERLAAAKKLGIPHVINGKTKDPVEEINSLTGGRGADVVIVAAGVEEVLRQSFLMAARYGQILYFAANMKESCAMPMDLIHYKELKLVGSYDSTTAYFEKALRAISAGSVDVKSLISHTYPLDGIGEAFRMADRGEGIKIMISNKE